MHRRVRSSRLLILLTAVVTALALVMPVGMARAATATVTAVADQVLHRGSNTVTFNHASPHTITATHGPTGTTASITVQVTPSAATDPVRDAALQRLGPN